ncbi:hypothetical protein HFO91_34080 [Rhizobium leguminosarum]|uniref:hypothetical protein n=1 Tax=Rhizobium leguminosarum TaxID=384 RepID=UPI001C95CF6D|nr:hypothetical protein [Rhizobium leguminosarum]MBY5454581.1 hypothetical protein [Rhizobium leguminosarum]
MTPGLMTALDGDTIMRNLFLVNAFRARMPHCIPFPATLAPQPAGLLLFNLLYPSPFIIGVESTSR